MTGILTSVAFALALLLGVGAAQAQTSEKLVSNTRQPIPEFREDFSYDHAQAFTTGSHAAGYTLTRVDLKVSHTGPMPTYTVSVHEDSSNQPGANLSTLTNPASLPSTAGLAEFTASGGIALAPNTTYWVMVDVDTGDENTRLIGTRSYDEDTGAVAGWTIANTLLYRSNTSTGAWVSWDYLFKFAVHGYVNPSVSNTGQTDGSDDTLNNDHAQAFTTGSHAAGYTLTRVDLEMQDTATTTPTYSVSVHEDSSSQPGTALGTLTNPASLPGAFGPVQFTASGDGIALAPNTTYWVVIDVSADKSGDTKVKRTALKAEDAGGATDWSIADGRFERVADSTTGTWTSQTANVLQMAVYSTLKPGVTAVALSSSPAADQTYGLQEKIRVQLTFNQAVDVTGTPQLKIDMGAPSGQKEATYESGSGTTMLTFVYTVEAADRAATGIAVLENTLALNSGTLKVAGTQNNVVLAHPGLAADPNHKVDGSLVNSSEVSIAAESATIVEGERAVFIVTASPAPTSRLTVNLEISQSGYFVAQLFLGEQTVVLTSGSQRYGVATMENTTYEVNGTVTATLRPGTGYTVHGTQNTATVSVHDNDSPPTPPGSGGNPSGSGSGSGGGGGSRVRDDHGNSAAGATPIAFRPATPRSSSIAGRINTQSDVDYFRLRLSQAGVLVIETNGSTDTRGNVWQAGEEMGAATDGGPGTNFRLATPVEAGDVVIAVAGEGGRTGGYTLRARLVVGSVENPQPASFQSGLGVLSGWVCEADGVTIEIEKETGEVVELAAAYGTERADTAAMCGDSANGFGVLFNWNLLGDGAHEVRVLVDGVALGARVVDGIELGRAPVTVTTLGAEFVEGLQGSFLVEDFPRAGEQVRLVWQESQQNFVLAPAEAGAASAPAQVSSAIEGVLENPRPASFQSGIGVISGWVCAADEVVIEIDGQPIAAAAGTERGDTLDRCGDVDNGFGLLVNWAEFGAGAHEVVALVDGVELSRATVTVTVVDATEPYVRGLTKRVELPGFPTPAETVTLEWQESQQNFIITRVD